MAESKASIYPPSNFFGSPPDENEDPYNRRVVRKLNDISFSDDSDPEEIANLKRMPKTVMNEENLKGRWKGFNMFTLHLFLEKNRRTL